jgi:hypothetical protein
LKNKNKELMSALLEAWPESPTSIGQNASQDNGSTVRTVRMGLFFTRSSFIILPVVLSPLSGFNYFLRLSPD